MTLETQWNEKEWQGHKWEFYKDGEGLWRWRAITPEGWDKKKAEWKSGDWNSSQWDKKNEGKSWDWLPEGINWVEVNRSKVGYKTKSECEADAKKHGWS
jgi:hypothetical protein